MFGRNKNITINYKAKNERLAKQKFLKDSQTKEKNGYTPISETWVQGSWSGGDFLGALILCLVRIGILIFIYMMIVKPSGTLTVIYKYEDKSKNISNNNSEHSSDTKICPMCAETIKEAAIICKYCKSDLNK